MFLFGAMAPHKNADSEKLIFCFCFIVVQCDGADGFIRVHF